MRRAGVHGALQRSPGGVGTGGAEDGEPVNVFVLVVLRGSGDGGCVGCREDSAGEQRSIDPAGHRECGCCRFDNFLINLRNNNSYLECPLNPDFCLCFLSGVAFYSISDIADRLLSTPAHPMPSLEEDYWLSRCASDPSGLLYTLLEELSPAAMAAFDLACCHCQLWKTSRQLLDTAERRLNSSLEARGMQPQF